VVNERRRINVLLVEDSAAEARLVLDALAFARRPGFDVRHVVRLSEAVAVLASDAVDVVVLDLGLPDADGLHGLERLQAAAPDAAIVVRTGLGDERVAIEALEAGAQDYLVKANGSEHTLERSILYALARRQAEDSARQLAAIVGSSDDAIIGKTLDGTITSWNAAAEPMYGYTAAEAIGSPIAMLCPSERQVEELQAVLARVARGERVAHFETTRRRRDGRIVDVSVTLSPIRGSRGEVVGASTVARDVTESKQALVALGEAEARFRAAFDKAPIGMALLEPDGRFVSVNDSICAILGYPRERLEGIKVASITDPDDLEVSREAMRSMLAGERTSYSAEMRQLHASGHRVHCSVHATLLRGADGAARHLLLQVQDITDRKRHEEQLRYLADHDSLTGLLNRRAFSRTLDAHAALVERYGAVGALLMIDLDNFKFVNDTLGHAAGDELIVHVARLLSERLRVTDVLARLGGDEFGVLLPKAAPSAAMHVAGSLLAAIRGETITVAGTDRRITASIGVATFEDPAGVSGEEILINADLALYDAKEDGRDAVALFSTEEHAQSRMKGRITWAHRIRAALEDDRFALLAQPIVELGTGRAPQYELLLRMADDDGDLIPPATFLYIAERLDLVQQIDRWVITNGIRMLAELGGANEAIALEINLSGCSLDDPSLLEHIDGELRNAGVAPHRVIFEITETAAVSSITKARAFGERLRLTGCRLALDDFGAGFGSFYYLKHLAFDFLKIDGEFVRNCHSGDADRRLIGAAPRDRPPRPLPPARRSRVAPARAMLAHRCRPPTSTRRCARRSAATAERSRACALTTSPRSSCARSSSASPSSSPARSTTSSTGTPTARARTTATSRAWPCCSPACPRRSPARPSTACAARASTRRCRLRARSSAVTPRSWSSAAWSR
jgi:diguanylate cyclase (GGDEF)-like protein/PAS domain S-box-containing protein